MIERVITFLLFQLISSIATYLIVLVQFQINEEQTGGKGVQSVHNFAAGAGGL